MDINHKEWDYEHDLPVYLGGAVDNYSQARKRHWENLGGFSAIEYDRAERFAQAVFKNSEQLMAAEEMDGDLAKLQNEINEVDKIPLYGERLFDILRSNLPEDEKRQRADELARQFPPEPQSEESPLKLVWERFIIDMSWEGIKKIEEGASRIFRLYTLVLRTTPSKATQQFLGRLSRCYIWGFDPECVILCRAVIDTAFRDVITDEICEKHFGKLRHKYDFSLSDRIQAALNEKIIDEDTAKKGRTVKELGTKAVHYQPDITQDVWGTITDTVAILERVTPQN